VGRTVATLHQELIAMLDRHHLPSSFHGRPNELEGAIRFTDDVGPRGYRPDTCDAAPPRAAGDCCRPSKLRLPRRFIGKASPVHFFWGSFDHWPYPLLGTAGARRTGRDFPVFRDRITREALQP
jgi:hypothetical protein